jgi:hypothetical protein
MKAGILSLVIVVCLLFISSIAAQDTVRVEKDLLGRHRVVRLHPNRTGAERHRALWGMRALASLWNKCFMHGDVVHAPRPHEQRIRRVRGSLITVPAALHHQPQIIFPCEVHRRRDVVCIACRHDVNAGFAHPRVHPSQRLRQARLVSDVIGIVNIVEQILAARASRVC